MVDQLALTVVVQLALTAEIMSAAYVDVETIACLLAEIDRRKSKNQN